MHVHAGDEKSNNHHDHENDHDHGHENEHKLKRKSIDPGYGLVAIVGLTPCVLFIPLTLRAAEVGGNAVISTMIVYFIGSTAAIITLTAFGLKGLQLIKFEFFEKFGEVITGLIISVMGVLVVAGLI